MRKSTGTVEQRNLDSPMWLFAAYTAKMPSLGLRRWERVSYDGAEDLAGARDYARQGMAVMVVVHDLDFAARWADTIFVVDHGKLVASGSLQEAITSDIIGSVYGVNARVDPTGEGLSIHIRSIR